MIDHLSIPVSDVEATARTYRYLDAAEVTAQSAQKKAAGKPGARK